MAYQYEVDIIKDALDAAMGLIGEVEHEDASDVVEMIDRALGELADIEMGDDIDIDVEHVVHKVEEIESLADDIRRELRN